MLKSQTLNRRFFVLKIKNLLSAVLIIVVLSLVALSGCSNDERIKAEATKKAAADNTTSNEGGSLANPGGKSGGSK